MLKRALLEIGRIYQCEKCKIKEWQGQPLTLQIHHIDENSYNHKAENLMFICPNCHTQTKNYAGKGANKGIKKPKRNYSKSKCLNCKKAISKTASSGYCKGCFPSSEANEAILAKKPNS